ncbi:hypothetical protein LSAT2_004247 [Lamellibrachia satsuma]|nr:hypothetical protein LSAT2_004247 [Lamellibrachia satsuma]
MCPFPQINWKIVLGSVLLQLVLGAILLRWRPAFDVIVYVTQVVSAPVQHILLPGAINVYVKVILLITAWGAVVILLFASGVQRLPVRVTSYMLQRTLGASAVDSLLIVEAIMSSSLEMIYIMERYLAVMTTPELHISLTALMAAWPSCLIPLHIAFKFPVEYIIIFSIMCAPATLVAVKLSHPDITQSRSWDDLELARVKMAPSQGHWSADGQKSASGCTDENSNDCNSRLSVILRDFTALLKIAVAVPLSMMGIVCFLNIAGMTLVNDVHSYIFRPLATVLGIDSGYGRHVAKLIGTKLFTLNLFSYVGIREALVLDKLDVRCAVISFFACSGPANLLRVTLVIAVIVFFRISRRDALLVQVVRAFVDANMAAFLTTCVAGMLYSDTPLSFKGATSDANPL